jgi:phospholipase/carboxylesterase
MLAGPEVAPKKGTSVNHLMIMLHGVGASGDDLISLAAPFQKEFPSMCFASPNAPFPYDNASFGHQWFSLQDMSKDTLIKDLRVSELYLNEFIDNKLKLLGLSDEHLTVLGFSQGTMVALHTLMRRPNPAALLLGFGGMMILPELLDHELKSRPRVALMHGDQDNVVPIAHMHTTYKALKKLGVEVSRHVYEGLGHSISQEGICDAITAIKKFTNDQAKQICI